MAHQAHNIPWALLSSCLSWRLSSRCDGDATNLHFSPRSDRGKKLTYFTTAFARDIHEHAECETRKHAADDSRAPPSLDEVVIGDRAAALIAPTIKRWRQAVERDQESKNARLGACAHRNDGCGCILPLFRRKTATFTQEFRAQGCYSDMHVSSSGFFSMEVFMAMLLHGQMEPLFRLCSHPDITLPTWWRQQECYCGSDFFGWFNVSRFALDVYIMLNVLLHFPQTWRKGHADYRRLKCYQEVVYRVTRRSDDELPSYPHRLFFGIKDDQFRSWVWDQPPSRERWLRPPSSRPRRVPENRHCQRSVLGHIPYEAFLDLDQVSGYLPSSEDVSHVRWVLCRKGLPTEVANIILQEASYFARSRLPVPDSPLHPSNRAELRKYLKYNWQLIVRTAALASRMGMEIDWQKQVSGSLLRLFGCSCKNHEAPSLYKMDYTTSERGVIKFL